MSKAADTSVDEAAKISAGDRSGRVVGDRWKRLRRLFWISTCLYVSVLVVLSLLENMLVYPAPPPSVGDWSPRFAYEDVHFRSTDGTKLHGWLLPAPENKPTSLWLLYCHGNGSQVANTAAYLDALRSELPANIFVFDYRGYGLSEGRPHERGVTADGEAALSWICERSGGDAEDIVLMGRSLGGAIAVHLAAEQGAKALVLERTFTRLTDAAKATYWWAPVDWVMRNRFPSIDKIPAYTGPLLCSHGRSDRLVPCGQGRQLFEAAGTPVHNKDFVLMEDVGHNGPDSEDYQRALADFLRSF